MKTKFLLFIAVFFTINTMANAQNDRNSHFGIKAGLDVASTTKDLTSLQNQLKGNWQAGVFFRYGKTLYIQPEVYYSQYTISESANAQFVKIPVMLGWRIFDLDVVAPHINVGGSYIQQLSKEYDTKGRFAFEAGIGTEVLNFITLDLRYTFGSVSKIDHSTLENIKDEANIFFANGGMLNLTAGIKF